MQSSTEPHLRSALFVPAHRADLVAKAQRSGADAVILDLEDSVPAGAHAQARDVVRDVLRDADPDGARLCLRSSAPSAPGFAGDVAAAVGPGLLALLLPKVRGPQDVIAAAELLDAAGPGADTVRLWPLLESAAAVVQAGEIAAVSTRVAYLGGGTSRGGDLAASLGYQWTEQGLETLYLRSRVLLEVRAQGIRYPMTGVATALDGLDAVAAFARQSRQLGYDGLMVIHPSHVPVANAVFGSSEAERSDALAVLAALDAAEERGHGAAVSEGHMVDAAMRGAAQRVLDRRPAG